MPEEIEVDAVGDDKATWRFYGRFPLAEIAAGRRACRKGWRTPLLPEYEMYAIVRTGMDGKYQLSFERETATHIEGYESFTDIEDLQAEDWYVEDPKK